MLKSEESEFNGWQRALLLIIPYFLVVTISQYIGFIAFGQTMTDAQDETTGQQVVVSAFGFVGGLLVIYLFMKHMDKKPFLDLGLYFRNHIRDTLYGLVAGLVVMAMGYFLLLFSGQLEYVKTNFIGHEFLLTIILFLIVSFSEEILLRGYILRNFMESMNNVWALVLSATMFSLMHSLNQNMSWVSYIDLFLAGILLGLPYIYTKNLWFPIALHFSWNFFQSLFGFNVSGLDAYSLIEFSIPENNIVNGGNFGFEGSVLSIMLQLGLIFTLYLIYKPKSKDSSEKNQSKNINPSGWQ